LWPGAWQKLQNFVQADSPDSADSLINPAKTPRYGKSTSVASKIFQPSHVDDSRERAAVENARKFPIL
jgi:hypothetical protein